MASDLRCDFERHGPGRFFMLPGSADAETLVAAVTQNDEEEDDDEA